MTSPKLAIYACGGAGSNLSQHVIQIPNREGFVEVERSIIDTSDSNITLNIGKEKIGHTFVQGVTGMGQNRKLANDAIRNHIDSHLNQNKPGTFNIVLFSLAGGTGSTAGPLIANELLKRGLPTICFVIASTEGGRETTNTLNTLKTLQNLSRVNKCPLIISYYQNGSEMTPTTTEFRCIGGKTKVNTKIAADIQHIALLCSEHHVGLDREDIKNWAFYNTVSTAAPSLIELFIASGDDEYSELDLNTASSASLLVEQDDVVPDLTQPYAVKGHYRESVHGESRMPVVHYMTSAAFIPDIVKNIKLTDDMYKEAEAALAAPVTTGLETDLDDDDDVMVF